TVNVAAWGLTGIFVGAFLRQRGVAVELVDRTNVLFLVTYADASREFERIVQQVAAAFTELEQLKTAPLTVVEPDTLPLSTTVLGLRQAFYAPVTTLAFATAEGRVAAEQVSFYPPGIPVLLPGELITWEIINYCQKMLALGLPVSGPQDSTLAQIRVVKA
ncbi:MAG: decarboxylase, partial [Acidaminococcaceae bacterium]